MLDSIWSAWLVVALLLTLVKRLFPSASRIKILERYVSVLGVATFFVWLTDGRLALFVALGATLALLALLLLIIKRAPPPALSQLTIAAQHLWRTALAIGVAVGITAECCGRWSDEAFIAWRGAVGGLVALAVGLFIVIREVRTNAH